LLLFFVLFGIFENPQYEKTKGKLPPQLAKSLTYPWRVSKKKILPLSAFFGLRGVVGNKGKF